MRSLRLALVHVVVAAMCVVGVVPADRAAASEHQWFAESVLSAALADLFARTTTPSRAPAAITPAAIAPGDTIANQPPPGVIDTVAGQAAVQGFTGDGGSSLDALLSDPTGLAFDADGNLFIADRGNLRVRRVDAVTGIITTVAGGGDYQNWIDVGPATSAYLTEPRAVTLGPDGDLYISDSSKIRKVDLGTGTISTVAGSGGAFCCSAYSGDGGPATAAALRAPHGVAVADNGDLYIADMGNQVIRKVDAATGIISTFAGVGSPAGFDGDGGPASAARFYNPRSLALTDDALYIADSGNGRVRRIDLSTGIITTIAGNVSSAGLAVDGTVATSGSLMRPYSIALDLGGDLYIAENGMSRIRRVEVATGIISTVVGTSTGNCGDGGPSIQACVYGPEAIAVAPNGVLALDSQARVALATPAPPPDPVSNPTLTYVRGNCCAPTRLVAGWAPPVTPINRVRVTVSPGGASASVAGTATEAHIVGFVDGERYTASIVAGNGWGWSEPVATPASTYGAAVPFDRFDATAEVDASITQSDLVNAYLLAIASKAVYGDPDAPDADQEAIIETAFSGLGLRDATFVDEPSTDTQFVVARRGGTIFATFRGTAGFGDMIVDAQLGQYGFDTTAGPVWAHNGFALALLSVYDRLRGELDALRTAFPDAEIVLTGHSLGGALAELAAVRLTDDGYPISSVHTVGAPNVGGAQLTQAYVDLGLASITHRWVNDHDVVPMAFDRVDGYTEVGRTHVFERGVSAPVLDAATQPVGLFGFFDHDIAIYAENLLRQISDSTLLPPPPARLADPLNSFDTETILADTLEWAVGIGGRTTEEIAAFLVEIEAVLAEVVPIVIGFLNEFIGFDDVVGILALAYGLGAQAMADALAAYVAAADLVDLARALIGQYDLDAATLTDVLEAAGYDPAVVADVVAGLFEALVTDLAAGLAGLADELSSWASAFGFAGDTGLLPSDLAALFGLDGELGDLPFPVLDPGATASEAATQLEGAGWSVDWVVGGAGDLAPPSVDDVIQVQRTMTVDSLATLAAAVGPSADGLLDGLADTLSLSATGAWDASLTVELVVGADASGFYIDPSTTITLHVVGSVAVADAETVAGVPAVIAGIVSADVTASASPSASGRIRPGPIAPVLESSLEGRIDTTLDADLGDVELTWTGASQLEVVSGTASANLLPGATLTGTATLPFLEPTTGITLAGTFLGAGGWLVEGELVGTPTAAGLTVTAGELSATLSPTGFTGRASLGVALLVGTGDPVVGDLVLDWSPSGTELVGSVRLDGVVAEPIAHFTGITLNVASTGTGTTIDLASDPGGSITLFPSVDLLTLDEPTGSLTTDGVLTLASDTATATVAGEILVTLDDPLVVLDPDAPVPSALVTVPTATATIPSLGDITVTITDLQLMNDGTVHVSSATANPGQISDTLGIAGILPFSIEEVSIVFPDPSEPLDRFDATVTGTFDFDALGGLPFTPILSVGARTVDATTPVADQSFTFTVRADSLSAGEIRPVDLGPITIGFADLAAGPVTLGAAITLGSYDDGVLVAPGGLSSGQVSGWMSVVAQGDGLSASVDATLTGSLDITPDGTTLDLAATLLVSGAYEDVFTVDNLSLGVGLTVEADETGIAVTRFDVDDVTVAELSLLFGDVARVSIRDASLQGGSGTFALAPEPGTNWITIEGTPADPGAQVQLVGDGVDGWGAAIGKFALRAVEGDGGAMVIVPVLLPGFYADVSIPESASLGFPDWLPLRFRNAGLTFPALSLDDLGDLGDGVELTSELLAGMRIRLSASLDGNETFPITGAVEGLEIDLGLLAAGEFPITNLDAAMFGVEPFAIGPMTVGGGLGLGVLGIDVDGDGVDDEQVFFGRVFGEFSYSGFGAGVDLVFTQYGPVLAKISAPTPIPLGTTGLMLSGVRGGIQFGGEGVAPPDDPRDLLGDPRYDLDVPITLDVIRESVASCVAKNAGRTGTPDATWPCFTWNDGGLVTIGTTLTSYAAPGVVSADLDGAIDLRFVRDDGGDLVLGPNGLPVPPALRLVATGTVGVWGIEVADAAVLVAFDDPLAPTLDMAAQMPGIRGPIGFLIPATGDYAVHIGTDGIAAGAIEATRILLVSVADGATTGSEQLFADALDELAASLERARTLTDEAGAPLDRVDAERVAPYRPLGLALLDLDADGEVDGAEARTIDPGFLLDRLLGRGGLDPLLPAIGLDTVDDLGTIAESLAPVLRSLQSALLAEAQRLVGSAPGGYPLAGPFDDEALATYGRAGLAFVEVMQRAVVEGIGSGAVAWAAVFDPVLRFEGGIQPVIAGVPFGEPTDRGTFTIGRDQLGFGVSGSVESLFLSVWGGIGVAAAELNKVLGVNTIVAAEGTLALPDVFAAVAQGDPMVLDPFDADWDVQLSATSKVAGFTLQESRGVLIPPNLEPAALRQLVCRIDRPDIAPCGGDLIPVDGDEHWAVIEEFGGLILSYELLAPRVATDPAGVVAELQLTPPDEWFGWFDLIRANFAATTALHQVGTYQIFIPGLQRFLDPSYAADQLWPVAKTDLERLGIATADAALGAAEEVRDAFFASGVWDVELLGLPLANGVISVDDDTFTVDAAFPMFGNVPITVEFGGVTVTSGSDSAHLPVPGVDATLAGADAEEALAGFGLPPTIGLAGDGSVRVQAYGPGYDPESTEALRRDGGVEVDATFDLDGLADGVALSLSVLGTDPATADLRGVATVDSLGPFAGVTITDALLVVERTGGVWSVGVTGDAMSPLGSGTVEATLSGDLTGDMTVRFGGALALGGFEIDVVVTITNERTARGLTFTAMMRGEIDVPALGWSRVAVEGVVDERGLDRLTVDITDATLGPVQLTDGSFELVRTADGWSLAVAAAAVVPGVLDPLSVSGALGPDGTGSLEVAGSGDLRLGVGSQPVLTLTDPMLTLVRTTTSARIVTSGDFSLLGVTLRVGGQLNVDTSAITGTLTVASPPGGVPFGTATLHGTFSLSITSSVPPLSAVPTMSAAVWFAGTAAVPGLASPLAVSGTIQPTGTSTLTVSGSTVAIDGFSLTDGSFTLVRESPAPAGAGVVTRLTVDAELAVLGVAATVDGTITVGTHLTASLALESAAPFTLGAFSLSGGFRLEIDAAGAHLGVTSEVTVPGLVVDAGVTGTIDLSSGQSGFLVGELTVDTPSFMPLGGSASSLRLRGSLTLARTVESVGRTSQVVTRLTLGGGTIEWVGVDTFSLPNVAIASDGSLDVTAAADSVTIGTFTLGLPSIGVHVGGAGAGTELRIGSANLAIAGVSAVTVPAFDVGTTGNFAVDLTLGTLEIGGYDIARASSTFRFERAGGIFRLRLTAAGSLGVPGLPSPISLDSFELATNGTVDAEISVDQIGPPALSIRDASIAFTRTATTGPVLTVTGGRLHLPVGEALTFPTLTFDESGQLARELTRSLTLGPGLAVSSVPLRVVAEDGVLALEQTVSRTFSMPLGPSLTFSGFRVATDGTFTGSVTGSVQPLGYALTNASFTISKPAGWVDARLQLDTPVTVGFGPASASVTGWVATNGRFRFTGTVEVPFGDRLNLFDVTTVGVSGSASLTLANTGLTGSFDGEMSIPLLCTVAMSGAIDATGTLTGSFRCNPPGPNNAFTQGVAVKLFSPLPVGNDTIRPSLAPIDDLAVFGTAPTPVYFTTSASDDRDDSPTITCTTASGSIVVSGSAFAAGETEVSCTAADNAGPPNVSLPRTFTVTVIQLATYQFVVDGRTVAPDDGTVELDPGSVVVVEDGGFLVGSPVVGRMHSTPILLGSATAATDGTVSLTFTMPAVAAGRHHLELTGIAPDGSPRQVVIPIDVRGSAPQATPDTTVPPAPNATLPRTGTDVASLAAFAAMLIAVGCALRRRQRWSR